MSGCSARSDEPVSDPSATEASAEVAEVADVAEVSKTAPRARKGRWLRIAVVVLVLLGLYIAGQTSGLLDDLDAEAVREKVRAAGPLGVLLFLAIFSGGLLVGLPGMAFLAASFLAYGTTFGFVVALVGSMVAITISFLLVRFTGGTALATVERPLIKRALAHLDRRPVGTVAVLRLIFWLAPPLNYALALTALRLRDYLVGSFLGLVPVVLGFALLFHFGLSG